MKYSKSTFLLLGSNLGDRKGNLLAAVKLIKNYMVVNKISNVYETAPYAGMRQPNYYNLAVEVCEDYQAYDLLLLMQQLERQLGRRPAARWAARIIDIDIIFKRNCVYSSARLTIPHYDYLNRDFVLEPIAEIAPDLVPPGQTLTISDML